MNEPLVQQELAQGEAVGERFHDELERRARRQDGELSDAFAADAARLADECSHEPPSRDALIAICRRVQNEARKRARLDRGEGER